MKRLAAVLAIAACLGCSRERVPATPIYPKAVAMVIPFAPGLAAQIDTSGDVRLLGHPFMSAHYVDGQGWRDTGSDTVFTRFDGHRWFMVTAHITVTAVKVE